MLSFMLSSPDVCKIYYVCIFFTSKKVQELIKACFKYPKFNLKNIFFIKNSYLDHKLTYFYDKIETLKLHFNKNRCRLILL